MRKVHQICGSRLDIPVVVIEVLLRVCEEVEVNFHVVRVNLAYSIGKSRP
jgi:hypothetical protein